MNRQTQLRNLLASTNYFSRQIGKGNIDAKTKSSFATAVNKLKLFCKIYKITITTFQMPSTSINNPYTVFVANPDDIRYNF